MGNIFGSNVLMSDEEKTFFEKNVGLKINRELSRGVFGVIYEAEFTREVKNLVKLTKAEAKNLELYPGPKQTAQKGAEELAREPHELTEAERTPQNVGDWISKYADMEGKKVALKWIKYDEENEASVRNEAETLDELQHDNIVEIRTAIWLGENRRMAIVMELSPLGSMENWLIQVKKGNKRMSVEQYFRFGKGLINGLKAMHMKGFVHRDLHDGNILIFPDPQRPGDEFNLIGKITDFGLIKRISNYFVDPKDEAKWLEGAEREEAKRTYLRQVADDQKRMADNLINMIDTVSEESKKDAFRNAYSQMSGMMYYKCQHLIEQVPHGTRKITWMGTTAFHEGLVRRGEELKNPKQKDE